MKRNQNLKNTPELTQKELSRRIAYHEAGHAAAIHLGNQQKGLPPVFFRIMISPLVSDLQLPECLEKTDKHYIAKVEGGRLIHTLPSSINEATSGFSLSQKLAFERAFDADIINLLAGPLAEAKYVALRDGEPISPKLVHPDSLPFYGGLSDMEIIDEYFDCIKDSAEQRKRKITDLYLEAFRFISEKSNWRAITAIAGYILTADKNIIEFDEIIAVSKCL